MPWLPNDFAHPTRVDLATGHHIRPIRPTDTDIDYPAVMGSQARLWSIFGPSWGWPPTTMTEDEDRRDLVRHAEEMLAHESFNYCILDSDETELLGCIYIDPPDHSDGGAESASDAWVCWWVVDGQVGGELEALLPSFVPGWLTEAWPFANPRVGLPA